MLLFTEPQSFFLILAVLVSVSLTLWSLCIVIPSRNHTIKFYKERIKTLEYWVSELQAVRYRADQVRNQQTVMEADLLKLQHSTIDQLVDLSKKQAAEITELETRIAAQDLILKEVNEITYSSFVAFRDQADIKNRLAFVLSKKS